MAVAMRFEHTDVGKALGYWVEGFTAPVSFHTWSAVLVDMDIKGLGMTTKTDRYALYRVLNKEAFGDDWESQRRASIGANISVDHEFVSTWWRT